MRLYGMSRIAGADPGVGPVLQPCQQRRLPRARRVISRAARVAHSLRHANRRRGRGNGLGRKLCRQPDARGTQVPSHVSPLLMLLMLDTCHGA